jgi:methyltransferase (TIGR00027 family)
MTEIQDRVSLTSRYMAVLRAVETEYSDRLFADPFADHLAGTQVMSELAEKLIEKRQAQDRELLSIVIRTRFFDDFLISSTQQIRQVVILGAGMDTRAFRLAWHPDVKIYELDRSEVIKTKKFLLGDVLAKCHRHTIEIDLRESWSDLLINHGFQANLPTVWLMEGLLYYLQEAEAHALLKTLSELSATGSCLGADLLNAYSVRSSTSEVAKYWHFGCDHPESLLAEYGWQASAVHPGDETAHYGRFLNYKFPSRDVLDVGRLFFVQAIKSD